jgi:predicted site-specific integrase-resolvase
LPLSIAPDLDEFLTTTRAANLIGVKVETIRKWRERGHLEVKGLDERGRPMYRWIDVVRAERATRDKAGRKYAA